MSSLVKRLALPAIVLLWSASYFVEVLGYSKKNQYLIKPAFAAMAILFVVNTITDVMEWKKEQRDAREREIREKETGEKETGERETGTEAAGRSPMPAEERQTLLRSLFVVLSMAAYILVLPYLGFVISTVLLVAGLLLLIVPFDYFAGGDAPEEINVDGYLKEGGTFAQMANAKELNEAINQYYGGHANFPPKTSWAFFDSSMRMRVEEFVQRLAPRGLFLIGSLHDTAYNYDDTVKIYNAAGPGKVLYTIDGYHNNWMLDGHPELDKVIENMVAFFDSYMK